MTEQIVLEPAGITAALNQLSEFQCQIDALELQKQELKADIMPEELRAALQQYNNELRAIDAEFAGRAEIANKNIASLRDIIKQTAIKHGSTVKGDHLMAVWNKPRPKWNNSMLDGLALEHPAIKACRTYSNASVTIRKR